MKIKTFNSGNLPDMEKEVQRFLNANMIVVSTNYSSSAVGNTMHYSLVIIYK